MECFAGFLSHTDEQIGRVLDFVRERGELDNTIVCVVSDNGASAEGGAEGSINDVRMLNIDPAQPEEMFARLDEIGGPLTHNNYPWGWTMAGNTPFRRWKREVHEGGVADPCIISWPVGTVQASTVEPNTVQASPVQASTVQASTVQANTVQASTVEASSVEASSVEPGAIRHQFAHAIDLLRHAGRARRRVASGRDRGQPRGTGKLDGTSLAYLSGRGRRRTRTARDSSTSENVRVRAIYHRGWKGVAFPPDRAAV